MRDTQVRDYSGVPIHEVQLGTDVDVEDAEAVNAALARAMEERDRLQRGELRKVKVPAGREGGVGFEVTSQPPTRARIRRAGPTTSEATMAKPITTGHMTNYDGWNKFEELAEDDEPSYELVEVSQEERQREAMQAQAKNNALGWREKGNAAFKLGDFAAAERLYSSGLRHLPSAVLFANRAQARLKLDLPGKAEADCSKALVLEPGHRKALVRRAAARSELRKFDGALADAKAARTADPTNKELKRLVRAVEATQLEHEYEQTLSRAAADPTCTEARALPPGAAEELVDVQAIVKLAMAAATDAEKMKGVRTALTKLRRLLKSSDRNRDLFALCGGVAAVIALYTEDNQAVLATVAEACRKNDRNVMALEKSPGVVEFLVKTLRDRRVAVIALALDLLYYLIPRMKTVATRLRQPPYLETLVLMMAKAPPSIHERVVGCLKLLAPNAALRCDLRAFGPTLVDGLARAATSASSDVQRDGVEAAHALVDADRKLVECLSKTDTLAQAYLDMLQREVETTPEVDRIEFAGGAEVIYRDLSRLRAERHHIVHTLLKTLRCLAAERRFVDHLDASDAWLLLLPLLRAPPQLRDAAVATLAAAAVVSPNASAALAELGAAEDLVTAATSATTAAALDAALMLTRACSDLPIFLNALKKQGSAIELAALCSSDRLSDAALGDLCWLLHNASVFDDGILTALSTDPTLGKRLVHLWYSRQGTTRQRIEVLLNKIMATQEGPEQLSAGMEEGQVLKFVEDLRAKRQIDVAAATGGANILHPSKYEPSGAPRAEDTLVEDSQREHDLSKVDAFKLYRYLSTVMPRGEPSPALVDMMPGSGQLALALAELFAGQHHVCVHVYGVEKEAQRVDRLTATATARGVRNFSAVQSATGAEAVPVRADVLLFAHLWMQLDEPVEDLLAALPKLKAGGRLCLLEDDPNVLMRAKSCALEAGCSLYSEPELGADVYACVLTFGEPPR